MGDGRWKSEFQRFHDFMSSNISLNGAGCKAAFKMR